MGVGALSSGAKRSFSDDVLRIEVGGPYEQHLSVVDGQYPSPLVIRVPFRQNKPGTQTTLHLKFEIC